jgi:hypothetical protein
MEEQSCAAFVERVRFDSESVCHNAPTHGVLKFQREVSAHPEILLNKMQLKVLVNTSIKECGGVIQQTIARIAELYTKYATSRDKLPSRPEKVLVMDIASSPHDLPPVVLSKTAQGRWIAASGRKPLRYVIRDKDGVVPANAVYRRSSDESER